MFYTCGFVFCGLHIFPVWLGSRRLSIYSVLKKLENFWDFIWFVSHAPFFHPKFPLFFQKWKHFRKKIFISRRLKICFYAHRKQGWLCPVQIVNSTAIWDETVPKMSHFHSEIIFRERNLHKNSRFVHLWTMSPRFRIIFFAVWNISEAKRPFTIQKLSQ